MSNIKTFIKEFIAWLKAIYTKPIAAVVPEAPATEPTIETTEDKPVSVLQLNILINSQPADGSSANTVRAIVTDSTGVPVPGAVVNFSVTSGAVTPAQGTTNANGQAVASVTGTAVGPVTLTAILPDGTTASVSTLYFVAVPAVDGALGTQLGGSRSAVGGAGVSGTGAVSSGGGAPNGSIGGIPVPAQSASVPTAPATDDVLTHVKNLLTLAGHDVEYVWDEIVAFAKKLA